jgi:hypothetical protein
MKTEDIQQLKNLSIKDIEEQFFDLDHENRIAHIPLEYEKPGDMFDGTIMSKVPKMSEDFIDCVIQSCELVPKKYKLNVDVVFDDLDGYTEEELSDICIKNILLEIKIRKRRTDRENRLALGLCVIGLLFILASILIGNVWTDGGTAQEVVMFILDIFATVPFWGAVEIYVIDSSEKRKIIEDLLRRFHAITFRKKQEA